MADTAFAALHRNEPSTPVEIADKDASKTKFGVEPIKPTTKPSDVDIPDNYVTRTLETQKRLPPVTLATLHKNIQYVCPTSQVRCIAEN